MRSVLLKTPPAETVTVTMSGDTYSVGFQMTAARDVSRQEYIAICEEMSVALNTLHHIDTIKVRPEPISGGGFVIITPDVPHAPYKTMRHYFREIKWPWVEADVMDSWRDDATVLIQANSRSGTFLKAFDGAPKWTKAELLAIKAVLEAHALRVRKMPRTIYSRV